MRASRAARRWRLGGVLFGFVGALHAGNIEVTAIETTVSDLDRARHFYTDVLQFTTADQAEDGERRTATLQLGEERLVLADPKVDGRAMPADVSANDLRFQHIAIVVSDIDEAYRRLVSHGVEIVSDGPQRLPDSNYDAAGIRALYFRDPDGHFLELIQFPDNKGEPKWRRRDGRLFLGIDHTAVVVRDVEASRRYYSETLGLTMTGTSLNYGPEQDRLNGLHDSRVKIVSLRGAMGPGIELLQYLQPTSERRDPDPAANDVLHWQINLHAHRLGVWGSQSSHRDPDGHALRFTEREGESSTFEFMFEALRQHWPRYLMEGAQLGIFMIVTLYLTLALEHPASPMRRKVPSALLRRVLMGVGIGSTVVLLIYSDWGRLSGAQFNPSVTLALLSLGRIEPWDAVFYIVAQFLGGWLGLWIAALPVRWAAAHKQINHVVTRPGERGTVVAFAGEFLISFLLLFSLLQMFQQPALKPWVGVVAGLHLLAFIAFEAPLSGMSLNPARSIASAIAAKDFKGIWIYFVAPPLAMQLAAQVCRLWTGS